MEQVNQYLPLVTGMLVFFIGGFIAVKVELAKRPTFDEANKRYKETKVCDEIHKSVDEKLGCIPEIKTLVTEINTTLKLHVKNNGK